MKFVQLLPLIIQELAITELDLHPDMRTFLATNVMIVDNCGFVFDQITRKMKRVINDFKKNFNEMITIIVKQSKTDDRCAHIEKYYVNGYKVFCDVLSSNHDTVTYNHRFEAKNVNHSIEQKYQAGIMVIYSFFIEMIIMTVSLYIQQYLIRHSTVVESSLTMIEQLNLEMRTNKHLFKVTDGTFYRYMPSSTRTSDQID